MTTCVITRVNNVEIVATGDSQKLVPIKPLCDALGIDSKVQRDKIQDHPILSSIWVLSTLVAADGKQREMLCLPLEYIFGWLFTINPSNVSEDARKYVIQYQLQCYRALYEYLLNPRLS